MNIKKKDMFIIILNIICTFIAIAYLVIGLIILSNLNLNSILTNVFTSIIFLIPYCFSIWFAIKNLKTNKLKPINPNNKKLSRNQTVLIITGIFSTLIFIFFFVYGLKGIFSLQQSIKDITSGVSYSNIYTSEQLLYHEHKLLTYNIFIFISNAVLFANYIYQATVYYLTMLNNTRITTNTTFNNNRKSE